MENRTMTKVRRNRIRFKWRGDSAIGVYQLALGVFLFLSPWLFAYSRGSVRLEVWLTGMAVTLISIFTVVAFAEWEEWLNLLLGIWLIVAPWALAFTHTTAMHVSVVVGIVLTYLALLDLWLIHYNHQSSPSTHHRS